MECASSHGERSCHLDASLAERRGVDGQVAVGDGDGAREVEAVGARGYDVNRAVVPNQVAAAVDAVAVGAGDVDSARVDRHDAFHQDAVLGVARDLQGAVSVDGKGSCGIEGSVHCAVGVVGYR